MKRIILAACVFVMFAPSVSMARVLSCPKLPIPEAIERAGAIFIGEVVEIVEPLSSDTTGPLPRDFYILKFKVEKAWKGVKAQEVSVLSDHGRHQFAFPAVRKGEKYLVYAEHPYSPEGPEKAWLIITNCTRTMPLIKANDDIKELEELAKSCYKNSPRVEEASADGDLLGNLKESQGTLRLPWYVFVTNDLRSVEEFIIGRRKSSDSCHLCDSLK